jgi:hypothetical protein
MNDQQTPQPHQQRVIDELVELDKKIKKLFSFAGSDIYNSLEEADRTLLDIQLSIMDTYSQVLRKRVSRF